jgi:RNA polymerase sigma factor for flagellar operon FliA
VTEPSVSPTTIPRPVHRAAPGLTSDFDEVVRDHVDFVKCIAYRLLARMPAGVDVEDLIQAGMVGLLCAARQFSPERGASFRSYAGIRVRGAMLDEARRADWAPRSVRRGVRELRQAATRLERQQGGEARPADVAGAMGMSLVDYYRLVNDAVVSRTVSLEQGSLSPESGPIDVADEERGLPDRELERRSLVSAVASAIDNLPERLRLVLSLYYDEELNLRQIGEVLAVTESRACQLHAQARQEVRARLTGWLEPAGCYV